MGLGLLQDNDSFSTNDYEYLVARVKTQSCGASRGITIWFLAESVASIIALRFTIT
jgi:hypothetical protein